MSDQVNWGTTRRVEVSDGARLLVRSTEAEPTRPVLLVLARHGGNSREFWSVAADLADRWCVVGIDLRGSGGSDRVPESVGYSQQQWAADLADVLEQTGLAPIAALGVSLGGMLLMDLHAAGVCRPERTAVVDIGPAFPEPADPEAMAERMATTLPLLAGSYPDLAGLATAWRTVQADVWPDVDDDTLLRSAAACGAERDGSWRFDCDVEGYMMRPPAAPPIMDRWDVWDALARETDTLVVRGATSEMLTVGAYERMIESERSAGLVVPGVGHWPPLDLEPTRSAIADWLNG
ncbi:MAG: alpha/beta fold hydrolase [Actinomycetota bacterium]